MRMWVALIAVLVAASPSLAQEVERTTSSPASEGAGGGGVYVFTSPDVIRVPASGTTSGPGDPYPAELLVEVPESEAVFDLDVTLTQVSYFRFAGALDLLLVSPQGEALVLVSDACNGVDPLVTSWTFDDEAFAPLPLFLDETCYDAIAKPTNHPPADAFPPPAPPASTATGLSLFDNRDPNGVWRLYPVDDQAGGFFGLIDGWSLRIQTLPYVTAVPGIGTSGVASPYPARYELAYDPTHFGRVVALVVVINVAHASPDDVDILLQAPNGEAAVLASDACGFEPVDLAWWFADDYDAMLSDDDASTCSSEFVRPADYESGEVWPAPAPPGPFGAQLDVFAGDSAEGEWKLWVVDDAQGGIGLVRSGWSVSVLLDGVFRDGFESGDANLWDVVAP